MADLKAWLADEQSEHDPLKLADALEEWWLYPKLDSADFIRDVIFCLRHLGQDWQPIETAPMVNRRDVLLCRASKGGRAMVGYWSEPQNVWITAPGGWKFEPTHWMPLPEPPK